MKQLTTVLFVICLSHFFSQNCTTPVVTPTTINGINVTSSGSGSVSTYTNSYTSCGYTTPANSIHLGANGAFTYTFNFSQPVNNLTIVITATGSVSNEEFNFNTDVGPASIVDNGSCATTISGNTINSGLNAPGSTGGGGAFTISASTCFNSLTVTGPGGENGSLFALCAASVSCSPPSCSPNVNITANGNYCSNNIILNATSDSSGGSWQWFLNNNALTGETNNSINISGNSYNIGAYKVVYVKNDCSDSASTTVSNACPEICDNGIDDDNDGLIDFNDSLDCFCEGFESTQTVSSLVPNSSFENHSCCPSGYSQLNCADTWIQASGPTSDYWHDCGAGFAAYYGDPGPKPDGQGMAGFINDVTYKEYIGACLLSPMLAGNSYTFDFYVGMVALSAPIDITFFGTPDCSDLPFTNGCPVGKGSWVELGSANVSGSGWINVQATFTPTQNINAIVIGPPCVNNTGLAYYYVDGLTLAETSGFGTMSVSQEGTFCSPNLTLKATSDTTGTWQWYKEGIALVGETDSILDIKANNLGTGNYTVRLTNGIKCEVSNYTLDTNFIASFNTIANQICSNLDTGKILVRDIIGTGVSAPFDYFIDGTGPSRDSNFTNLTPGTYEIVVRDSAHGCSDTVTATVTGLAIPTANFRFDTVCIGNQTTFRDFSLVAIGGSITNHEWLIDGNTINGNTTTYSFPNEGPHPVRYVVTANTGCTDTITKNVVLELTPTASFIPMNGCQNDLLTFTNQTTVKGVVNPPGYTYNWDFGNTNTAITNSNSPNASHAYTSDGTFNVTLQATSARGCTDGTTISITVYPLPVASFNANDTCFGMESILTNTSTISSGSIVNNNWTFDGNQFASQNVNHVASTDGTLAATLIVESDNGCFDTVTNPVTIHSLPIANFSFTPEQPNVFDRNICFTNTSSNASTYQWNFGLNNQTSTSNEPCVIYPEIGDTTYTIQLVANSQFNCKDTIYKTIFIQEVFSIHVPNAFTPNKDNTNDTFKPYHTGVKEIKFMVFDRWGEKLFETTQLNTGWDGVYKNELSQQDVYIYRVVATDIIGKKHVRTGHFTLIQ